MGSAHNGQYVEDDCEIESSAEVSLKSIHEAQQSWCVKLVLAIADKNSVFMHSCSGHEIAHGCGCECADKISDVGLKALGDSIGPYLMVSDFSRDRGVVCCEVDLTCTHMCMNMRVFDPGIFRHAGYEIFLFLP